MLDYHFASPAKYAAAYIRISRSSVTRTNSFLSRLISSDSALAYAESLRDFRHRIASFRDLTNGIAFEISLKFDLLMVAFLPHF